jgi:hypothetical protein
VQLPARADPELDEHRAQVPFDGSGGQEQLGANLGAGEGWSCRSTGSAPSRLQVLPDILHYDRTQPATYPNGRVPTDDVYSQRFAWLTNGKVPPSGLKPHDDLLPHFPYLGPPNPSYS